MTDTSDLTPERRRELAATFSAAGGGANYDALRPSYPPEVVDWLTAGLPHPARVADVGAGTGKLTRLLAAAGHQVVAVDPSTDMLDQLRGPDRSADGLIETRVGTGEALPLPDASLDLVVYAQAWHWVDPVVAAAQARRVLRPGGRLALIWNVRDDTPAWQLGLGSVMPAPPAEHLARDLAENPRLPGGFGELEAADFRWTRVMSRRSIADLVTTRSQYLSAGPAERAEQYAKVADFLAAEFPALGPDDDLELAYRTYCFRATRP